MTQPLITAVIEPFIDSTGHFLDFIVRYNDSTIFTAVTQLFLLQWLSHFFISSDILEISLDIYVISSCFYNDSIIFVVSSDILKISPVIFKFFLHATVPWPFLLQCLDHFIYFINHFYDLITSHHCDSIIFFYFVSHFLDFVGYFFILPYRTTVTQLFLYFLVIIDILLTISIILSDIINISLSHL
jgi:hypothetical protein